MRGDLISGYLSNLYYVHVEDWRNRHLQGGRCLYIYVDGHAGER